MQVRKAVVAGQFYPGNRDDLLQMLGEMFEAVKFDKEPVKSPVNALIAPHAGYIFSGRQAAKAYQYLKEGQYDLVCIISPSHREYFPGISIYPGDAYKTPLGICPVHEEARAQALACNGISSGFDGHRAEHALEVQLPFLQYTLKDIPILPVVMGDQGEASIEEMAACVKKLYGTYRDKILFVASSDLSHFHSSEQAAKMDGTFIDLLSGSKIDEAYRKLERHEVEACGGGPILSVMKGLEISNAEIRALGYSHSGQVLHDNESVVGYTSAIIIKEH
jgi:AmmeMemoRadiSam system protein B